MIVRGLFTFFYLQDSYLDPHYEATDVEESSSDDEVVEQNQARKRRRGEPKKKMEGIIYEEENLTHELEPDNAVCDTTAYTEEEEQEEETREKQQQPANLLDQLTGFSEKNLFTGK